TGATSSTYVVTANDTDSTLACTVTATNSSGSASATSAELLPGTTGTAPSTGPVTNPGTGTPSSPATGLPANLTRPALRGALLIGATLTCSPGTWTNSPSFMYQWLRSGIPFGRTGGGTYRIRATDAAVAISCRVIASNSFGSAIATTASVTAFGGGG